MTDWLLRLATALQRLPHEPTKDASGFARWWGLWALVGALAIAVAVAVGWGGDAALGAVWKALGWCSVRDAAC